MSKANVLFLCTGNSVRSQIAEGFLKYYASDRFDVYSAGLAPKGIHPFSIRVMAELGIDISTQTSDHVDSLGGRRYYAYIITVCANADENCPSGLLAMGREKLHWSFEDPASLIGTEEDILSAFREVREQIDQQVKLWLKELESAKI